MENSTLELELNTLSSKEIVDSPLFSSIADSLSIGNDWLWLWRLDRWVDSIWTWLDSTDNRVDSIWMDSLTLEWLQLSESWRVGVRLLTGGVSLATVLWLTTLSLRERGLAEDWHRGEFRDLMEPNDFWDPLSSSRELSLCFLMDWRFYKLIQDHITVMYRVEVLRVRAVNY